jgi:titin
VTDTSDSATDTASLRYAIIESNAATGQTNTIDFAIPGTGVQTISPLSSLPAITQSVLIDGESQPGYAGTPLIQVNGQNAGAVDGLTVTGSSVTIRGLDIVGFSTGAGIHISGVSAIGNSVYGNFLGSDPSGQTAVPNFDGIAIQSGATNNTIGGATPGARNLISGNSGDGVHIVDSGTTGNAVEGNFIGSDLSGSKPLGNGASGVAIFNGASNNLIGGAGAAAGNTISGNSGYGVYISDSGTAGNVVRGDLIGTDASGTHALANGSGGVVIKSGATNNTIGGTTVEARDVISGNSSNGVGIGNGGTTGNVVEGDYIGTDLSGSQCLGNAASGVSLYAGASRNTIGGTAAGAGNTISANSADGVSISDSGTASNVVEADLIGTDASGTHALGNGWTGVAIQFLATNNTIGGMAAGTGNLISANGGTGVSFVGADLNQLVGNKIGTNVAGTSALGNGWWGVGVAESEHVTVGGTTPAARNLISGNHEGGLTIQGIQSVGDVVQGNFIGTDVTGALALGNAFSGVLVGDWGLADNSPSNATIGGTAAGAGNVISANGEFGVWISGSGTSGVLVQGNVIGTDVTGSVNLGNTWSGVQINAGASNNTIGGTTAAAGNVIAANRGAGVWVIDNSVDNQITANRIFANTGLRIALGNSSSPNPSHGNMPAAGPNNLLNAPVITSVGYGSLTDVTVSFVSLPSSPYRLDFYASGGPGNTGEDWLGSVTVKTDANGQLAQARTFSLPVVTSAGSWITATATDEAGDTSEFSNEMPLTARSCQVSVVPSLTSPAYGQSLTFRATVAAAGSAPTEPAGTIQFKVDGAPLGNAVTLADGTATSVSTSTLRAGVHTITAIYSGNATYSTYTATTSLTIAPAPLTITKVNLVLTKQLVSQIVIVFSGPVHFAAPNGLGNYQLIAAGKNNSFSTKEGAKAILLRSVAYNAVNDTVTLIPQKPFALTRKVQLRVTGQTPRVL